MNTFWPYYCMKHSKSFQFRTSFTTTFLRQYFDFLSTIFTRILGTTHFNLFFFFSSPSASFYLACIYFRSSLVNYLASVIATRTTELLLASSTIKSVSFTSTTTAINPSWGPFKITTYAPTSNFGFFSSFSCYAPSPSPLGLGLRTSGSVSAFFLLWPMPRQGVYPIDWRRERPKFSIGLVEQVSRLGASAYWEKEASCCFISFKIL